MKPAMVLSEEQKIVRFRKKDERSKSDTLVRQRRRSIDKGVQPKPKPRRFSMFDLPQNLTPMVENPPHFQSNENLQLESLNTPNVERELRMEQTRDEIQELFENVPQLDLQSDTLAQLESTLRLASEMDFGTNGNSNGQNELTPFFDTSQSTELLDLWEKSNAQNGNEELAELYLHSFMTEYQETTNTIRADSTLVQAIATLQLYPNAYNTELQKKETDEILLLISNQYDHFTDKQDSIQVSFSI